MTHVEEEQRKNEAQKIKKGKIRILISFFHFPENKAEKVSIGCFHKIGVFQNGCLRVSS